MNRKNKKAPSGAFLLVDINGVNAILKIKGKRYEVCKIY